MNLLTRFVKRRDTQRDERRRERQEQLAEELGALRVFTFDETTTSTMPQMGEATR